MAKFYGNIGFADTQEVRPGIWEEKVIERKYRGDILRNSRRYEATENLNSDLNISNQFSIVANSYLYENASAIRYITWMGTKWSITSIDIAYPRLIISIGGVYNGPKN